MERYEPQTPGYTPRRTCNHSGCASLAQLNAKGVSVGHCSEHLGKLSRYREVGSRTVNQHGYVTLKLADDEPPVLEHRHVMAQILGRKLLPGETVHHRNGDRTDNRPDNLELWVVAQRFGQRLDDLADYLVKYHPEVLQQALERARQT